MQFGVADGTRTHDDQNHNLGLYQLSYSHRRASYCSVKNYLSALMAESDGFGTKISALKRFFSMS